MWFRIVFYFWIKIQGVSKIGGLTRETKLLKKLFIFSSLLDVFYLNFDHLFQKQLSLDFRRDYTYL